MSTETERLADMLEKAERERQALNDLCRTHEKDIFDLLNQNKALTERLAATEKRWELERTATAFDRERSSALIDQLKEKNELLTRVAHLAQELVEEGYDEVVIRDLELALLAVTP